MKKAGVVDYLHDLGLRLKEIARRTSDPKARFALETLSLEISNKAQGVVETFTISEKPQRPSAGAETF